MPNLRLTRDRGHSADLLLPKSVDDRRFAGVGVSNEADRNLFPVGVQGGKLAKQLDERTFTKGVIDRGMERKSGIIL